MVDDNPAPKIVAFVADLLFASRIESAAGSLGLDLIWVENAEQIAPAQPPAGEREIGEQLTGQGAVLLEMLTRLHPALLIFDLSNQRIPWREWLPMLKSAPATRRLPVLCYGSHVDAETMRLARSCGAEKVVARSAFVRSMPDLLRETALQQDPIALEKSCQEALSALAIQGLEEFNRGEFFEAHESLETAWKQDSSPGRELYRAILQVAVAYLQIQRANYRGAMKMFLRMRQWIDPLPDQCRRVEVGELRANAYAAYEELRALGPEEIGRFDPKLFRPVRYIL